VWTSDLTDYGAFEMDELHWFIERKYFTESRTNTYIMTMMSRYPRQIVGYAVDKSVNSAALQKVADSVGYAKEYFTDGCLTYLDVIFGGKHRRNAENKNDTHNIESTNADLRHYIRCLARRSRCFFRTVETLNAVLSLFIDAYNKFGEAKFKHQVPVKHKSPLPANRLHKYRYPTFSALDFL